MDTRLKSLRLAAGETGDVPVAELDTESLQREVHRLVILAVAREAKRRGDVGRFANWFHECYAKASASIQHIVEAVCRILDEFARRRIANEFEAFRRIEAVTAA